jgi:DNA modification methylase
MTIINQLLAGQAAQVMAGFPDGCVDLVITSPPYWTAVSYDGGCPWGSYEEYLADLQTVWSQCAGILCPNAKLCINVPLMPIRWRLFFCAQLAGPSRSRRSWPARRVFAQPA